MPLSQRVKNSIKSEIARLQNQRMKHLNAMNAASQKVIECDDDITALTKNLSEQDTEELPEKEDKHTGKFNPHKAA